MRNPLFQLHKALCAGVRQAGCRITGGATHKVTAFRDCGLGRAVRIRSSAPDITARAPSERFEVLVGRAGENRSRQGRRNTDRRPAHRWGGTGSSAVALMNYCKRLLVNTCLFSVACCHYDCTLAFLNQGNYGAYQCLGHSQMCLDATVCNYQC
jgi:hypothetical protein